VLAFKVLILQRPTPAVRNGHTFTVNAANDTAATPIAFATAGHASITTTMNVYGRAMPDIKREANSKVVRMVLKQEKREPIAAAPLAVSS